MLPGPGGDPIRNPAVLPTGKNIHALDPQSIPTQAAIKSARIVVERWVCCMTQHVSMLSVSACSEHKSALVVERWVAA